MTWASHVAATGEKLRTIAIDYSWSFDTNVLRVGRGDHYDVAVTGRDIVTRSVVLDLWATKQTSFGGELQRDVALEFNGAGNEIAGRNQNSPAFSFAQVSIAFWTAIVLTVAPSPTAPKSTIL